MAGTSQQDGMREPWDRPAYPRDRADRSCMVRCSAAGRHCQTSVLESADMADDKARASRETLEKVEPDEEVENPAGNGWAALLLGFLGTPAGQALNEKVADWV